MVFRNHTRAQIWRHKQELRFQYLVTPVHRNPSFFIRSKETFSTNCVSSLGLLENKAACLSSQLPSFFGYSFFSPFPSFLGLKVFFFSVTVLLGITISSFREQLRDYNDVFLFNVVSLKPFRALCSSVTNWFSRLSYYQYLCLCRARAGENLSHVPDKPVPTTFDRSFQALFLFFWS